jgi:hypothetical protein
LRDSFLAQACGDDAELRLEVESLLSYETESAMLLDRPALEVAVRALAADRRSRMIGRTLGHYRIEAWLGAGGMGEVYRAIDTRLDRAVAVKALSQHLSTHPDALARFETEAKAAAALSHPNILAIDDFGDEDGIAYASRSFWTAKPCGRGWPALLWNWAARWRSRWRWRRGWPRRTRKGSPTATSSPKTSS